MPEWLITVVVAVIAAAGGWGSAFLQSRAKSRDDRQALIDQLQEERNYADEQRRLEREAFSIELAKEREQIAAERVEYTTRLDRMWADKAASRAHVAQLNDHIWQRKPPPPPEPPAGYIH
ncbi:hypothetical protein ABIQ69_11590 [Agromyces sp. G08B096]|uniref:Uncharacterized protein n=1 Tax=Agromyces sp. G08B096 TaxID=3156399 RepID=A0AAU7W4Z9_9MICO